MSTFEEYFTLTCGIIFAGIIVLSWFSLMLMITTKLIKSIRENPVGSSILKGGMKVAGYAVVAAIIIAGLLFFSGNLSKIGVWIIINYTLLLRIAFFAVVISSAFLFILPIIIHDQMEEWIYATLQSKEKDSRYNNEEASDRALDIYDWCFLGAVIIWMLPITAFVIVGTLLEIVC